MVYAKFPEISGKSLNKLPITLPNDFKRKLNILILPCSKVNKLILERWASFMDTLISDISFLDYYQINIFNKKLKVLRRYIEARARRNILNRNLEKVIHIYQELTVLKKILDLKDHKSIYIFLINNKGDILWRTEGRYDLEKAQLLKQKIIEHMSEF
jgi:hypothetical protein